MMLYGPLLPFTTDLLTNPDYITTCGQHSLYIKYIETLTVLVMNDWCT